MKKPPLEDITCDEALKRVFDYVDGHIAERPGQELERHLELCRHCFDRVEFEKQLKARLRGLKLYAPSARLRTRVETLLNQF